MKKQAYLTLTIAVFLCTAIIYWKTSCVTLISYSDSAELITASYTMGVPHAPGYPLYMMLGKAFSLLISGDVTHRYSLLSCLLGATTVMLVFFIVMKITSNGIASFLAALTLAFSYHFWLFSLVPEVSALHGFFVALFLYILINRDGFFTMRRIYLISFIYGLSLTHHHTILLMAPAIIIYILISPKARSLRLNEFVKIILFFMLGLLPYLYIPIAASLEPTINSLKSKGIMEIVNFIARRGYGTLQLSPEYIKFSPEIIMKALRFYIRALTNSFYIPGIFLGVVGIIWSWYKSRRESLLLFISFILAGPFFYAITRMPATTISEQAVLEKFMTASFIIFAIFIGCGFYHILTRIAHRIKLSLRLERHAFRIITLLVIIALPAGLLFSNFPDVNKSNFYLSRMYIHDLFKCLKNDSIILIHGDTSLFSSRYIQLVEGKRRDVQVFNINEADVVGILYRNYGKKPIYMVGLPGNEFAKYGFNGNPYVLQPWGLVFEVSNRLAPGKDDRELWESFDFDGGLKITDVTDLYAKETLLFYAIAHYNKAVTIVKAGHVKEARMEARKALEIYPDFQPATNFLANTE